MGYVGKINISVNCLYGSFNIIENEEVPMLIAIKFPEYVTKIDEPIIVVEPIEAEQPKTKKLKEKEYTDDEL